jgi:LemA protein
MSTGWIILIVVVVVVALFLVLLYNGLVRRRNIVDEAWNQISVQLKRRHDLIPNLVNAVKGYMEFEQDTLTKVVNARNAAVTASAAGPAGAAQSAQAENALTGMLRQLFALVENYPQLKANENVMQLQEQLTTTENQIAFSRQHYNASVRDYNVSIQTFPAVVIAGAMGFTARDYFQIEEADTAVPAVDISLRS